MSNLQEEINLVSNDVDKKDPEKNASILKISLMSAILTLASAIIGTGIFMTPNGVVKALPSIFYSLCVWAACGIISLLGALCYAELGGMYVSAGGEYEYFGQAYHESVPFSFLFTNFLFIKPVTLALLILFFVSTSISAIVPSTTTIPLWVPKLCSVVFTIFLCILNCASQNISTLVNNYLTYIKFICMGIIISLSIYKLAIKEFDNIKDFGFVIPFSFTSLSSAMYSGMWAYDGFNQLGYTVGSMKNPKKNVVPATVIGIGVVLVFYLVLNFSYFILLGVAGLKATDNVAKSAVFPFMQKYSAIVMIMVALSAFATANVTAFSAVGIYSDAAEKGHLPKFFGIITKTSGTMIPALIAQAFLTIVFLVLTPDVGVLLTYFSGASWVFYGLTFVSVIVLRFKDKESHRVFTVPIIIPFFLAAVSLSLVILGFLDDWISSLVSVSSIIVSFPIYLTFVRNGGILKNHCGFLKKINIKIDAWINGKKDLSQPPKEL